MPIFEVQAGGKTYEVDAPSMEIAVQAFAPKKTAQTYDGSEYGSPVDGMSTFDKLAASAGKAAVDAGRGFRQLGGMITGDTSVQSEIDQAKALDAPLMKTKAGMAGNLLGNVALLAVPGRVLGMAGKAPVVGNALAKVGQVLSAPSSAKQAAAVGAVLGGIQPVASGDSRTANVLMGAGSGAAGQKLAAGLSRVAKPETAPEVRALLDRGVTPTPGQIAGETANRLEQGLSSVPVLGDAIKMGRYKAVEQFNRAVADEVLAPIGEKVPKSIAPGHQMVKYAGDKLSDAYKALTPRLAAVVDDEFRADIKTLGTMAAQLPTDKAKQLQRIINEQVAKKLSPAGGMAGETIKEVESELGSLASRYSGSLDPDQQTLGNGIREVQAALRRMVGRQNPEAADELAKINAGWARLTRLETAAGRVGSREGVFSPEALLGAVKQGDKTVRDRAFARGDALLQDLAESGVKVLGRTVPDSGTPYRLMAAGGAGGMLLDPTIAVGTGLGATAYGTNIGRRAMAGLLSMRPQGAAPLAAAIERFAPTAGLLGAAAYPSLR